MLTTILFMATIFLAYNNGANDNFKGVATLYGAKILDFKSALILATIATILGSISAIFLTNGLIESFSGKGLVPQEIAGSINFLISIGFGAGATVLLATLLGFPISTTHALVGSLIGAGIMAAGLDINFSNLGNAFIIPLLTSPFIAFLLSAIIYLFFTKLRKIIPVTKESCLCIGKKKQFVPIKVLSNHQLQNFAKDINIDNKANLHVELANHEKCVEIYTNKVFGFSLQKLLDFTHISSGVAVAFARGLNDTPKIAGLLVAAKTFDMSYGMVAIALGMTVGGLLNSAKVAETMSKKIIKINQSQGLCANLTTSFLVIIASNFGLPVSTTHVSVGSIFGIGLITKKHNSKIIKNILLSWVITLPVGMFFSMSIYKLMSIYV